MANKVVTGYWIARATGISNSIPNNDCPSRREIEAIYPPGGGSVKVTIMPQFDLDDLVSQEGIKIEFLKPRVEVDVKDKYSHTDNCITEKTGNITRNDSRLPIFISIKNPNSKRITVTVSVARHTDEVLYRKNQFNVGGGRIGREKMWEEIKQEHYCSYIQSIVKSINPGESVDLKAKSEYIENLTTTQDSIGIRKWTQEYFTNVAIADPSGAFELILK